MIERKRGEGRIYRRPHSAYFWIQYYNTRGERIRESTDETDEKKAGKVLLRKLGEVAAGIHQDSRHLTYESLRDGLYLEYRTNNRKSLRFDENGAPRLNSVKRLDGFFTGYRARQIDTNLIRQFIADQQQRAKSNGSINRSLAALKRMFSIARQDGKLRATPYIPMLKEAPPRSGFLEREGYDALRLALPSHLRLPLALGFFGAMRLGEIMRLDWNQVDFIENFIHLRSGETKNDAPRSVPIVPELRALLVEQHAKRQGFPLVCFRIDAKGHPQRIRDFRRSWYASCAKCGLGKWELAPGETEPRPDEKRKVRRLFRGLLFHDLRRSGIRHMIRSGISEHVAQMISGHKSRSVFSRYDIVSENDLKDAADKLAKFLDSKKFGHTLGTQEAKIDGKQSVTQ